VGRLALVSTAQLGTGIVGMTVAIRRGHAYEFLFLKGRADRVARESLLLGTALSAPVAFLATQALAIKVLAERRDPDAVGILRLLGATYVVGYLGERLVRERLRHWDPVETPLAAVSIALAAAMAAGEAQAPKASPTLATT
jgi:hypothetical protein